MNRINKDSEVAIAIDGSLYRYHPTFHDLMMEKIATLTPKRKVSVTISSVRELFIQPTYALWGVWWKMDSSDYGVILFEP